MIEEKQVTAEESQESDDSQKHNGQESDDEIRADIHISPLEAAMCSSYEAACHRTCGCLMQNHLTS